jgi:hypothetical protein
MAAQIYQILGRALRQIEFSTVQVIPRLPVGNLMELYGKSQLLPQLARSGIGMTRLRCGTAFNEDQHRTQSAPIFEFLTLTIRLVRQQRKLV